MRLSRKIFPLLCICSILYSSEKAEVTLSVLYFENLSGQERFAALRKVFTDLLITDLSAIKGLTLVEREQVENVFKEIALGQTGAVDEASAPKIGTMLGAKYLISGSYTADRRTVVVQYKLLAVETGKIIASGSVDGDGARILKLKNILSRSVADNLKKAFPQIILPSLKTESYDVSVDQMNDYGTALDYKDKGDYKKAEEIIKTIIEEVPDYQRFRLELTDIEKRIVTYDKAHAQAVEDQRKAPATYQSFIQVTTSYMTSMQYSKLLQYCISLRPSPPPAPEGSMVTSAEMIDYYIFTACNSLKQWEKTVEEGESFLKNWPTSMYYGSVKMTLGFAINEMKEQGARLNRAKQNAKPLLEKYDAAGKSEKDLLAYQIASSYMGEQLYKEALLYLAKIDLGKLEKQQIPGDIVLFQLFMCYYNLLNKTEAQKVFAITESRYPQSANLQSMRTMMAVFAE